jgi:hypothetical protein
MEKSIPYKKIILLSCVVVAILAGLLVVQKYVKGREAPGTPAAPRKETLAIYLPLDEARLTRKNVEIKDNLSEREKADVIMRELRMGNAVPDKLTLREFSVNSENVLYLNLSQDIKGESLNAAGEIMSLYAIVNSFLANLREAKSVQVLIDGQAVSTINGVVYTYSPIEFNNQLLEE